MEKHRETGKNVENTEKQGESRKNVAEHMGREKKGRKTQKNMENQGKTWKNTGKQGKT